MTKEELREKRNLAIENLNHAIAILGSDELYIDELEQENAELKEQNTNLQEMLKTERSVTCKEEYLKKVTDLEQEIAELNEAIKHINPCGEWNDDVHDCEFRHYAIEYGSQFTKAKKIIKTFLGFAEAFGYSPSMDKFISEAEQFLKEVEK